MIHLEKKTRGLDLPKLKNYISPSFYLTRCYLHMAFALTIFEDIFLEVSLPYITMFLR